MLSLSKIPILLVDDRPENLVAIEIILNDSEYELVKASSGNEALRQTLKRDFALVLLDVQMPDMDGFETAELMRANPKTRHLPIIFVTAGMSDKTHLFKGYESGAVDYLIKPIEPQFLRSKVKVFCDLYVQRRSIEVNERNLEKRTAELERMEVVLKRQHDHLRRVLDTSETVMLELDCDGVVQMVNRKGCELLGYPQDKILGRNWFKNFLLKKNGIVPELQAFRDLIAGSLGDATFHEHAVLTRDGNERMIAWHNTLFRDEQGRIVGTLLDGLDVTELRDAESRLRIAKEQAEAANRAKSAFLANMSHELRTPLNAILGYAQILMRKKDLSDQSFAGLNTIQRSGEHLLLLINDVLDLSKIESGKFELYPATVDLPRFLKVIGDIVRVKAEGKNLVFTCDPAQDLPKYVDIDEKRLRQILLNLLDNAVKFTDHGQVSMRVWTLLVTDRKARLGFEVQDTGVGMNEHEIHTIFEAFEQVGDIQRRYGGTGLGLAISHQLVCLMGSELQLKTEFGKGSLFSFELQVPVVDMAVSAFSFGRAMTGYKGRRRKVLVVDDMLENRLMLVDLLRGVGFETFEAGDGLEGLQQVQAVQPDCVITDIVMPVMDGLEVIRQIRQISDLCKLPILVVSASASRSDKATSLEAGADVFFPKPIEQQLLLREIGERLGLIWVSDPNQEMEADEAVAAPPLVAPPMDEMKILHELAKMGDMRRIREYATHLIALNQRYRPFAEKLERLALGFESKEILRLVERFLDT